MKAEDTTTTTTKSSALETAYREALARFKKDKTNKDLRRAKTAAKRAWDAAILDECQDEGAKALHCKDCSQMFLWTSKDQDYYRLERNWMHTPQRCKACAKARKAPNQKPSPQDGKNMCYAFQKTGSCPYGDKCKFNHDPKYCANYHKETKEESAILIPICKWGTNCTMKKCRYKHVDVQVTEAPVAANERSKTVPTGICKWGKNCKLKRCRLQHLDDEPTPTVCIPAVEESKNHDKSVIKVMRKALKKAPKKQLTVKELRKLIASTNTSLGKDQAKILVKETIAKNTHKLVLLEGGKMVGLARDN